MLASAGGLELHLPLPALLALMVAMLVASFGFSGTETAMFSLQKVDLQRMGNAGATGARILRLLRDRGALITTILMGNETVNVLLAATGTELFSHVTDNHGLTTVLNIAIITPTLLLFSEITPKILAFRFNTYWARAAAWPLTGFYFAVFLPRMAITFVVRITARLVGVTREPRAEGLQEEELLTLLGQSAAAGNVDQTEVEIIENVFEFDDLTVGRLMTPRPDMFALPLDVGWRSLLDRCRAAGFSRVPIYRGGPEDIVGVLIVKDLLKHRRTPPAGPRQLQTLLLSPAFVPRSKPAHDMLSEFLERKFHMAFVVNEHGTLVGLVTLDDLLEELFGDLADDDETDDPGIDLSHPGQYIVKAWMDTEDFAEETKIHLPPGEYHTVGGFVFHELGRLPTRGDEVQWSGWRFRVKNMDKRRISEIEVSPDSVTDREAS